MSPPIVDIWTGNARESPPPTSAPMTPSTTMMSNTRFILVSCRRSFGERELYLRPYLPVGSEIGPYDVVIRRDLRVHRQLADVEDLPDASAERDGPLLTRRSLPVGREDRRAGEIETALEVVVDEGLQEEVV